MNSSSTHISIPNNLSPSKMDSSCSSKCPSTATLIGTVKDPAESVVDMGLYSDKPVVYDENIAFSHRTRTEYDNIVNALSNLLLKYFVDNVQMEKCLAPELFEDESFVEEEMREIRTNYKEPDIPRNPSSESYDSEKERQQNVQPEPEVPDTNERPRGLSLMSRQSRASSSRLAKLKKDLNKIKDELPPTRYPSRLSIKSIKSVVQDEDSEETEDLNCDDISREDVNEQDYFLKYKGRDQNVIVEFKNGNKYEGRISCFMMEGEGTYTWKDGTKFEGSFINGVAQGQGHFSWPDGSWYNGEVKNNLRHGRGICVIKKTNGLIYYIGKWKDGKRHGSGIILFGEYDWYDGKWKNNKMHGRGLRQYPSGSRYLGEWKKGKPHGEGTMVWSLRDTYTGKWKNGKMHGRGTYTWRAFKATDFVFPLQNIYDGYWKNGKRHGVGRLLLASGAVILTKWVDDIKEGPGQIICKNGLIFDSPFLFTNDKLCNIGRPIVVPPWNKWYYDFLLPYQDGIVADPEIECESARVYDEYEKQIGYFSSKMPPLGTKRKGCLNNIPLLSSVQTMPLWRFIEMSFEEEGFVKCESGNLYMTEETVKRMSFEELWLRKVLANRMPDINIIYQHYAKLCCDEPPESSCFLLRFMLEQMCLDCGIANTSYTLMSLNQEIGFGCYPFDVVPVFEMIHYMLYLTYSVCVKHKMINNNIPGLWGGAFDYFISNVAIPAMKKTNTLIQICENLPINEAYNIYIIIGVPVTMIKILTFFSISEEDEICGNINFMDRVSTDKRGKNIIYPDGSIVFEEAQNRDINPETNVVSTENYWSINELANLGDTIIKDALFTICSQACEDPTIIYDYEVSFLEFCKFIMVLVEEYKNITYNISENNEVFNIEEASSKHESRTKKVRTRSSVGKKVRVIDLSPRLKHDGLFRKKLLIINESLISNKSPDFIGSFEDKLCTKNSNFLTNDKISKINKTCHPKKQTSEDLLMVNIRIKNQETHIDSCENETFVERKLIETSIKDSGLNLNSSSSEQIELEEEKMKQECTISSNGECRISSISSNSYSSETPESNLVGQNLTGFFTEAKTDVTDGIQNNGENIKNNVVQNAELGWVGSPQKDISYSLGKNNYKEYDLGLENNIEEDKNSENNGLVNENSNFSIIKRFESESDLISSMMPDSINAITNISPKEDTISNNAKIKLKLNLWGKNSLDELLPDHNNMIMKKKSKNNKNGSYKIKSNSLSPALGTKIFNKNPSEEENINLNVEKIKDPNQTKYLKNMNKEKCREESGSKNYKINENKCSRKLAEGQRKHTHLFCDNKKEFLNNLKEYHRAISSNGSQHKLTECCQNV